MFYYLSGELALTDVSTAVIDCGGVGYKLTVSQNTMSALDRTARGGKVKLYTHMAVREDDVELFGFYSTEELDAFRLLIGVSGIGPKAAMGVLSAFTPDGLARAIFSEDTKAISKANGIGAKGAARIVLELKGKFSADVSPLSTNAAGAPASTPAAAGGTLTEAAEALLSLGYSRPEINAALAKIDAAGKDAGEIIRLALAQFMKG